MSWSLDDIDWSRFDRTKVRPELIRIAKAACLVEHNGGAYGAYLCSVFHDDPAFCEAAKTWAREENQHGEALRRWVEMADPAFDFEDAFARFTAKIKLPLDADRSVRGSRTAELISRCIVEVGTSSYYSALHDGTEEPVFRDVCLHIAGDEFRHYKLFYDHMKRYRDRERPFLLQRLWVAFSRMHEVDDDELAYAYYCGNGFTEPYRRRRFMRAYKTTAFAYYRAAHIERGALMVLKAAGLKPQSWYGRVLTRALRLIYRQRGSVDALPQGAAA